MMKRLGTVVLLSGLAVPAAHAQVATGPWTSSSPSYTTQQKGCGVVSGSTFTLSCSDTSGEQRAERRYSNYSSKTHQFEGYLKVSSLGGSRICVKQTFKNNPAGP